MTADNLQLEIIADTRFRRDVTRLHRLGPRVLAELLAEIGAERSIQTILDQKVARYSAIEHRHLTAAGGCDFPPVPLHVVTP